MSVVDHRASWAAHGKRGSSARYIGGSFTPRSRNIDEGKINIPTAGGSGAFHSHNNLMGSGDGKKRPGLNSDSARRLSVSTREGLSSSDRRVMPMKRLSGYGAASVRHFDQDLETDDSIRSLLGTSRRSSISAGEGFPLLKHHSERRKISGKKDRDTCTHEESNIEVEEPREEVMPSTEKIKGATNKTVQFATVSVRHRDTCTQEESKIEVEEPREGARPSTEKIRGVRNKTVQFATVSIRHYPTVVGCNPFVSSGPPLELAWDHEPSTTESNLPIDIYEEAREPYRRREWDLALSRGERESRLLEAGCNRKEIAGAVNETSRIKAQRANTVMNLKMAGVEEFVESTYRTGAKFVGLRKSSDWMYNTWKRNEDIYLRESISPSIRRPSSELLSKKPPPIHVVQQIDSCVHAPASPASPKQYDGPAFGIAYTSQSSRVLPKGDSDGQNYIHGVWAFAVIRIVYPGSPAEAAGLRRGDRIITFGTITALNNDHCKAIPQLAEAAARKEIPIALEVEDGRGERREVTIRPQKWNGRGYLGFLFRELTDTTSG